MALATYSDLTTSILSFLRRPGDTKIPVDDLVTLFEADATTKLKTHFQEVSTTLSTVGGTATVALPADFLQARELSNITSDPVIVLDYYSPPALDKLYPFTDTGEPFGYAIEGTNLRFAPIPDGVYSIRLEYYQKITPLISGVNWLYQNYPHIYLFGALAEAELFIGADDGDERFGIWLTRRDQIYDTIRNADRKFKTGGAPLRMRVNPPWSSGISWSWF